MIRCALVVYPANPMFLPSRHYVSEHTTFIRQLLARDPRLVEDQKKGRAIWWDKEPADLAERATMDEGRVPQPRVRVPDEVATPSRRLGSRRRGEPI